MLSYVLYKSRRIIREGICKIPSFCKSVGKSVWKCFSCSENVNTQRDDKPGEIQKVQAMFKKMYDAKADKADDKADKAHKAEVLRLFKRCFDLDEVEDDNALELLRDEIEWFPRLVRKTAAEVEAIRIEAGGCVKSEARARARVVRRPNKILPAVAASPSRVNQSCSGSCEEGAVIGKKPRVRVRAVSRPKKEPLSSQTSRVKSTCVSASTNTEKAKAKREAYCGKEAEDMAKSMQVSKKEQAPEIKGHRVKTEQVEISRLKAASGTQSRPARVEVAVQKGLKLGVKGNGLQVFMVYPDGGLTELGIKENK